MKNIFIILLLIINSYAATYSTEETNGVYNISVDEHEMVVIKLNAKNNGYAQINKTPSQCGTLHLLDSTGKNLGSLLSLYSSMNKKVKKGQLKLMVIPKNECKVSFSIPD